MKIKLLLLEGCNRCADLKNALEVNNVAFSYMICKDDSTFCDEVEDLTGVFNYPMVIYENEFGSVKDIFYLSNDYTKIGKLHNLKEGITGLAFYSIEQLINYIIK